MNTEDTLQLIRSHVRGLNPGFRETFSAELMEMARPKPTGIFALVEVRSVEELVLEQIIGSSFEIWHETDPITGNVTFGRLQKPLDDGRRASISADRKHHFKKNGRFWEPIKP